MKVVFVLPPRDIRYPSLEHYAPCPPTGACIIAYETLRRLKTNNIQIKPEFEIRFPDSITDNMIIELAQADILGIVDWFHTHNPGMELIRKVKELNPSILTIAGGVNASALGRQILLNRSFVDLVVTGEGEDILWRIIAGQGYASIPNLLYRINGQIMATQKKEIDLSEIGLWDFELCNPNDLNKWKENKNSLAPAGISITRGCIKRDQKGPCIFCSNCGHYRETPCEKAINQVRHLQSTGVNNFFETGDDFTSIPLLEKLATMVNENPVPFREVYASPANVNRECALLMKKIGVSDVFLGFAPEIETAISNLTAVGINISTGILLGLPGKTVEQDEETTEVLKSLVEKYPSVKRVLISLAIPFAGSPWYYRLLTDEHICKAYQDITGRILSDDDDPEYLTLVKLSLDKSFEKVANIASKLREELSKTIKVGSFGFIEGFN